MGSKDEKKKKCTKCDEEKLLTEFYHNKKKKRHTTRCKKCINKQRKVYRKNNKEKIKEQKKVYRKNNKEKIREQNKEYRKNNKEKTRERQKIYYENNKERLKEKAKKNREKNENKRRDRYKSTPSLRLNSSISVSIRRSLKSKNLSKNGRHWEDLVSYTIQELKDHLESLFTEGMTWENYGYYGWHVDHVIAKSFFVFTSTDDVEFKYCWSLDNLQPLWAPDNFSKGSKVILISLIKNSPA